MQKRVSLKSIRQPYSTKKLFIWAWMSLLSFAMFCVWSYSVFTNSMKDKDPRNQRITSICSWKHELNPCREQHLICIGFLRTLVSCTVRNKRFIPSWGCIYFCVTRKPQKHHHYENAERHFTMAALAFQTVTQGITKHYVVMLLLTDTSLQSVDLEMSHLKLAIISGKVSCMTTVIINKEKIKSIQN